MKKFFMLVLVVVCCIWLFPFGVVLAENQKIHGQVTVENKEYKDVTTNEKGGVFYIYSDGDLKIVSSTFVNNKSTNSSGGAIYNEGKTTITDGVTFISNSAGNSGGAIYNNDGSTMTIDGQNVAFTNNIATSSGGAIYNENSTMTI